MNKSQREKPDKATKIQELIKKANENFNNASKEFGIDSASLRDVVIEVDGAMRMSSKVSKKSADNSKNVSPTMMARG